MKEKLKSIASVQMGYTFRSRLQLSKNGNVSVIQMKDLTVDNIVDCTGLAQIEMENIKKHHLVQKNDLIFRSRGLLSNSAIILDDLENVVVAAPLLKIRINQPEKILPKYLNWYIDQVDAQKYLTSRTKGTVQKMISKQELEELEIVFPNRDTQNSIVELASLADHEQVLTQKLAAKRQQYISTLLMHVAKGE